MILSLIVAMEERGGIGYRGKVPWKLRSDLRRFKAITMGHHLIMGRVTWDSIGRPLPGRVNIVISRRANWVADGCIVVPTLAKALEMARAAHETEAFVIGGSQVYALALPIADRIYLTRVHAQVPCDTFFPAWNAEEWEVVGECEHPQNEGDEYASTYCLLIRHSKIKA